MFIPLKILHDSPTTKYVDKSYTNTLLLRRTFRLSAIFLRVFSSFKRHLRRQRKVIILLKVQKDRNLFQLVWQFFCYCKFVEGIVEKSNSLASASCDF